MTGSPGMPEWLAGLKITAGQRTMLADRSLFYLAGHFDRPHFYHFSKKHKPQQTQKKYKGRKCVTKPNVLVYEYITSQPCVFMTGPN